MFKNYLILFVAMTQLSFAYASSDCNRAERNLQLLETNDEIIRDMEQNLTKELETLGQSQSDAEIRVRIIENMKQLISNQERISSKAEEDINQNKCPHQSARVLRISRSQKSRLENLLASIPVTNVEVSISSCNTFINSFHEKESMFEARSVLPLGYDGDERVEFYNFLQENPQLLNCRGSRNSTPLTEAIGYSSYTFKYFMAKALIESGADVNLKGKLRKTPLELIAFNLRSNVVYSANYTRNDRSRVLRIERMLIEKRAEEENSSSNEK